MLMLILSSVSFIYRKVDFLLFSLRMKMSSAGSGSHPLDEAIPKDPQNIYYLQSAGSLKKKQKKKKECADHKCPLSPSNITKQSIPSSLG